ncbi:MarR family winged helix-turn-helix transcriptional regulator [Arthrobacter sp. Cr_A7]|uniref:MarR family winged helix-turn-helix transcriptional regulator n=1 Tax=Arthrobacter sp. Cr_A7 TaxID=3031017 RepID=UPI0023DA1870|nr:MarR family winged helix-turn-helix transcriptional regulator [Arthrobacter sp. Cr_A7]MDF2051441.1 MarR family winged helix-turn-helix transcriptional regulator [Arthrobacter sp. Cr_A7]
MTSDTGAGGRLETADKLVPASISGDAGFLLAKLHAAGSVVNNKALEEFKLKERSYSVLALAASGLTPSQREMAGFLSLDPSQIVALVDDLEKRGLVLRSPDKQDRRARIVTATASGERLYTAATKATRQAEAEALNRLSAEEVRELKRLLRKALWSGLEG